MSKTSVYRPWLRLVRLPNLLTVPGDPVAGFLLASAAVPGAFAWGALAASVGASLSLYAFGLMLNDLVDVETDTRERPERPLPAGELTVPQVRMAAIALALSGLNLALAAGRPTLMVAAGLSGLILMYNAVLKRLPVAGVAAMGLCRGLSLALGAVAARPELVRLPVRPEWGSVLVSACGLTVYVSAFSAIAKREAEAEKGMGRSRWLPFAALLVFLPAVLAVVSGRGGMSGVLPTVYVFLMVMTLMRAWLLGGPLYRLQPVSETVGGHIRNLMMVQACLCVAAGGGMGVGAALGLLGASVVFRRLARLFYSS